MVGEVYEPFVSIIIPTKRISYLVEEAVSHILKVDYKSYEILVLPDEESAEVYRNTKIIATGPVGPAEKRDLAFEHSEGEILAFLDDDAYPREDWLREAVKHFKDPEVAAVGGPAVTPQTDGLLQKASGAIFASRICSGNYTYRYVPKEMQEVDDFPSVNLLIRKNVFEEVGGFNTNYWPGEDTKICLDITKKLNKKIIYDPDVFVWHHRRSLLMPHLRQTARYALHRGYFVKAFPETSRRFGYFVPSLFVLGLSAGVLLSFVSSAVMCAYLGLMGLYAVLLCITGFSAAWFNKSPSIGVLVIPGIFLTHVTYGLYFLKGLMVKEIYK